MYPHQAQLLNQIKRLETNQAYLLKDPTTPQQQFLHLLGQRYLLNRNMFHKNIQKNLDYLRGSFAQRVLQYSYTSFLLTNRLQPVGECPLAKMIEDWIEYYPSIRQKGKYLFNQMVLQGNDSPQQPNYSLYMYYLELISIDLMKLLKPETPEKDFFNQTNFRQELERVKKSKILQQVLVSDLLMFISSCLPKVILNILLGKQALSSQMRQYQQFECLYINRQVQYLLRNCIKVGLLLRQLMLILLNLPLNETQQKFMMLVSLRYYYVFHLDRAYNASQIIIYAFNKLDDQIKYSMRDEFALFFRILIKLGKKKFISFIVRSSQYLRKVVEIAQDNSFIGYSQQAATPYNSQQLGQTIQIQRGKTVVRYFEVLKECSIFYFRVLVSSQDVTVRLSYMGDITSSKQSNILLFTHEKHSGQLKRCINAIKRGIYMFQFDNSYSWLNSKTLVYENLIFEPMEIVAEDQYTWLPALYDNYRLNTLAEGRKAQVLKRSKPQKKKLANGVVYLEKEDDEIVVRLQKRGSQYTYCTDNPQRMSQKIRQINNSSDKYKWAIMNKVVHDMRQIQEFLRGNQQPLEQASQNSSKKHIKKQNVEQQIKQGYVQSPRHSPQAASTKDSKEQKQSNKGQIKLSQVKQLIDEKSEKQTEPSIVDRPQAKKQAEVQQKQESPKEIQDVREIQRQVLYGTQEDQEYQVVEHQLEKSYIMGDKRALGTVTKTDKKEQIRFNTEQTEDFYQNDD